jgi:HEAT repeat protein
MTQKPTDSRIREHIKRLSNDDEHFRLDAVLTLANIGQPAVPSLIAALSSANPITRCYAAAALQRMKENAAPAVPALIGRLADDDAKVRSEAAWALGTLNAQFVVEHSDYVAAVRALRKSLRGSPSRR